MEKLKVSELFYSLQGEGRRAGEPSIFIRLQGCSAKHACFASGVMCDTEFESGSEIGIDFLEEKIKSMSSDCEWIVWTGGEPADQLTDSIIEFFKDLGYKQAIETSGLKAVPNGIDWITVSPKVAEHVMAKNFKHVNELKYVRHSGQSIPEPIVTADHYYISPHFDGFNSNDANIKHCIDLCLKNPKWNLSVQQHKLLTIL